MNIHWRHKVMTGLLIGLALFIGSKLVQAHGPDLSNLPPRGMPPMAMPGAPGMLPPPPLMANLELSDEQQDKAFAIWHTAAPAIYEKSRNLIRAKDRLRLLTLSKETDAETLARQAQLVGSTTADLLLLHANTERQFFALLTVKQQKKLTSLPPFPPPAP